MTRAEPEKKERNEQIFFMSRDGLTLKEIAYQFKVSPSRIYEIYDKERTRRKEPKPDKGHWFKLYKVNKYQE